MSTHPLRGEVWWCEPPAGGRQRVAVSVGVMLERLGTLSGARMLEVCAALNIATDCS